MYKNNALLRYDEKIVNHFKNLVESQFKNRSLSLLCARIAFIKLNDEKTENTPCNSRSRFSDTSDICA